MNSQFSVHFWFELDGPPISLKTPFHHSVWYGCGTGVAGRPHHESMPVAVIPIGGGRPRRCVSIIRGDGQFLKLRAHSILVARFLAAPWRGSDRRSPRHRSPSWIVLNGVLGWRRAEPVAACALVSYGRKEAWQIFSKASTRRLIPALHEALRPPRRSVAGGGRSRALTLRTGSARRCPSFLRDRSWASR